VNIADTYRYVDSPGYDTDLVATHLVWTSQLVLETAGTFVFLTYLSLPVLVAVRSGRGVPARSTLDGQAEQAFLLRLVDLTGQSAWQGGIKNARVQHMAEALYKRHVDFAGMQPEYMDFIGAIIALGPLRVLQRAQQYVHDQDRAGYWRYMKHALSLLGADIGSEEAAQDNCASFIEAHSAPSADGSILLESLVQHHPRFVERAVPALFRRSRSTVSELMMRL
jgi:hypothetical protein